MKRTMYADHLNAVANDPSVASGAQIDLTAVLSNPANVAFENEHGGFIFIKDEAARYELHTLFLPEGRGAAVLPNAAEAFRRMFIETDCMEIITKVAGSNRAADMMARRAGFRPIFTRTAAWVDGSDLTFFVMTFDDWRARDGEVALAGHAFHHLLEGAKARTGSTHDNHADDEAHDRAAGAASLMVLAGNAPKAVWAYNRWARFAGYQTIELQAVQPPVIDVRDAVLGVREGKLEVLFCR